MGLLPIPNATRGLTRLAYESYARARRAFAWRYLTDSLRVCNEDEIKYRFNYLRR